MEGTTYRGDLLHRGLLGKYTKKKYIAIEEILHLKANMYVENYKSTTRNIDKYLNFRLKDLPPKKKVSLKNLKSSAQDFACSNTY